MRTSQITRRVASAWLKRRFGAVPEEPTWLAQLLREAVAYRSDKDVSPTVALARIITRHVPGAAMREAVYTHSVYVTSPLFKQRLRISDHPKPGSAKKPWELYPSSYPLRALPKAVDRTLRAALSGARSYTTIPSWGELQVAPPDDAGAPGSPENLPDLSGLSPELRARAEVKAGWYVERGYDLVKWAVFEDRYADDPSKTSEESALHAATALVLRYLAARRR